VNPDIQQKMESNETKLSYKDHLVWLTSYEVPSGGWVPRAVVILPSALGNGEQELLAPGAGTVSTREEADGQAFTMGKQWIDKRLADLRTDQTTS
jgi:hypothetical protein